MLRILLYLLLGFPILAISSCQTLPARTTTAPKPVAPVPEKPLPRKSPHQGEINALLEQAKYDLQHKRLTTPLNNNAYFCYSRVLALDPDNPQARQGIRRIADEYLAWAIDNANAGNYRLAKKYLGKAASLDPDHPNIPAVQKLIAEHQHANKLTYYLPVDGLDHRADWVVRELTDIGHMVTKKHATVIITARNDAEGRWIYQQLNAATPDRVHARLEIGDKPKVRLIY